jgi:hypothetical protein
MEPEKKSNGAFIGLVIIIIILIVGGIYIWQSKVKQMEALKVQSEAVTAEDANSINSLEQDLNSLDTNIDVDVNTLK